MTSPPDVKRFAELAASPCPPAAELLISLAAEFDAIDADRRAGASWTTPARGLFGIAQLPAIEQAQRLAAALDAELALEPVADDPAGLLIHRVLESRRGHPAMLAAIGVELAVRAGADAARVLLAHPLVRRPHRRGAGRRCCSTPGWAPAAGCVPGQVRGYCSHELAFCILTGLSQRYQAQRMRIRAQRAERLRRALPVEPGEPHRHGG